MKFLRPLASKIKYGLLGYLVEPYFCLWSYIYLKRWRPTIIVITGSVGKTSLLHFLKDQMGDLADYSEKANTKIGLTLNLLDLKAPQSGQRWRWLALPFQAPFKAFFNPVRETKFYLAEYDVANLLATYLFKIWLRPQICLWVSLSPAHLEFFDKKSKKTGYEAFDILAKEFAKIVYSAHQQIFALASNKKMRRHLEGCATPINWLKDDLVGYDVNLRKTTFIFKDDTVFTFKQPMPLAMAQSLILAKALLRFLDIKSKTAVKWLSPPGRNTLLKGYKGCYLIDSTYNAQLESVEATFKMFQHLKFKGDKWLVCGDMIEQGKATIPFHRELARMILEIKPNRIFLIGSRIGEHTYPLLKKDYPQIFWQPKIDANFLDILKQEITGSEIILFKGAGFLDIIVEALLKNSAAKKFLNEPGKHAYLLRSS